MLVRPAITKVRMNEGSEARAVTPLPETPDSRALLFRPGVEVPHGEVSGRKTDGG
jgi:hypothetical protein